MQHHRATKKELERITVDRKIVEGLRNGRSLTQLTKSTGKGKGYVIKIRDLALEHGFIEPLPDNKQTIFREGPIIRFNGARFNGARSNSGMHRQFLRQMTCCDHN